MDIPMPHENESGVDCCGCLVVREDGVNVELYCNECGAVVVSGEENVKAYVARFLGDPTTVSMDVCPHLRDAQHVSSSDGGPRVRV